MLDSTRVFFAHTISVHVGNFQRQVRMMVRILLVFLFAAICTNSINAELQPSEIVVLARAGDKNSEAVAKYYAKIR
ncbi:hypothetical protein ACFL2H_05280, partial [Planctomycetota bacterium]